jgi:hypothetical protein
MRVIYYNNKNYGQNKTASDTNAKHWMRVDCNPESARLHVAELLRFQAQSHTFSSELAKCRYRTECYSLEKTREFSLDNPGTGPQYVWDPAKG